MLDKSLQNTTCVSIRTERSYPLNNQSQQTRSHCRYACKPGCIHITGLPPLRLVKQLNIGERSGAAG